MGITQYINHNVFGRRMADIQQASRVALDDDHPLIDMVKINDHH